MCRGGESVVVTSVHTLTEGRAAGGGGGGVGVPEGGGAGAKCGSRMHADCSGSTASPEVWQAMLLVDTQTWRTCEVARDAVSLLHTDNSGYSAASGCGGCTV